MVALKPVLTVIYTVLLYSVESCKLCRDIGEFLGLVDTNEGVCKQNKYRIVDTMNVTSINSVRIDKNCQQNCDYRNETVYRKHLYYKDVVMNTCCSNYYLSKNGEHCIRCNVECNNGWCNSSNTCVCEIGYNKDRSDPFTCYPARCKQNCINGICIEEDQCICKKNYILDPENKYICIPVCEKGFQRNPKNKFRCERGCYPPCPSNGACEAGECICNDGYDNVNHSCVPRCRPCDNGKICVSPHTCSCPSGFFEDNQGTCTPSCVPDCKEGVCTSPGVCTPFCTIKRQTGGQYRIQEICLFNNTLIAAHNRETCFNPEVCLVNCKCNNKDCFCDIVTVTTTTNTDTTTSSSSPDVRTRIGDFSDSEAHTDSSNIVTGAAVAVALVLGVAAAVGIVIRKRSKKSGGQVILNDIYRFQKSPGDNAYDVDNEIYEETNEYQVIEEKRPN